MSIFMVIQEDLDGNHVAFHDSINAASKSTGISRSSISANINKRSKSAGGFKWVRFYSQEGVLQYFNL